MNQSDAATVLPTAASATDLWTEFVHEVDTLIDITRATEASYVEGRGMSLASIAVGSAAMRLFKVR